MGRWQCLRQRAGTAGSSGAEARVAGDAPESRAVKPVAPEGPTALPKASQSMVRPTVRPWRPPVVPQATAEEDEVEEIERAKPRLQFI